MKTRVLALATLLVLVLAACGGDDAGTTSAEEPEAEAEATSAEEPAEEPEEAEPDEAEPEEEATSAEEPEEEAEEEPAASGDEAPEEVLFLNPAANDLLYGFGLISADRGLDQELGVSLQVESTGGSGFATQQLVAGNAPFGSPVAPDVFLANEQGADLRFLGCQHQTNIFVVTVPEDSEIQSIEELEGRPIGVTELGGGEFPTLRGALGSVGLSEEDVEVIPIGTGGPQTLRAIEDGTVEAFTGSFVDVAFLGVAGLELRDITPEAVGDVPGACLVGSQEAIDADPERAQAVTELWRESIRLAAEEPDEIFDMLCGEVPEQCEPEESARALFDANNSLAQPSPDAEIGVVSVEALQRLSDFMVEVGLIEEAPEDVSDYISEFAMTG
ncbi:ABC transporter substrate-binding protein [Euzebya tangerina]|uniref:ABC transporter substrate-binding protein n=1 Tax=Euzebya tangerina TaxID=591198 RepID=UPI0013C2CD1F|nr:ABC transporter substrate-binding protein [Euzebya tangerina]